MTATPGIIHSFRLIAVIGLLLLIPKTSSATSISCGQTVAGTITSPSEVDQYTLSGVVGQKILIAFSWGCGNAGQVDIYYPGASTPDTNIIVGCNGDAITLTLPSSGVYTLLVHSQNESGVNSYSMSIQSPLGGCESTAISCGQTLTSSLTNSTEMAAYTYEGSAGQTLLFALSWGCGNAGTADIYDPSGNWVTNMSIGCSGTIVRLTLASSGAYTILIHESQYAGVNSYSLSIQSPVGGGCDSTAIFCGQTVVSNLTYSTEMAAYTYEGSAGQTLLFALSWGCGNAGTADIYDPSGNWVTNMSIGCNGTIVRLTLASSGAYTILIHESQYAGINSYSLSLQSLTGGGCNSTSISCGQTVNASTSFATEMDAYGFGTGGGTVVFSFNGYGGARFDFYGQAGNFMFTGTPGTEITTNLAAGIYTILVHDASYAGTGSYGFTATCIGTPCNLVVSPGGPIAVGASATNGAIAVNDESGCGWTAIANVSWLHIATGNSGSGNGSVNYSVDANPVAGARTGTITIAPAGSANGFTIIVDQANPVGFTSADIGDPGAPGSFNYSNGVYTVTGSGEGTDGSADVFYYLYQTLPGNAQIIARLTSLGGGDPTLAEAGAMIRQSLDPGSAQVSLSVNTSTNVIFRRRLTSDTISIEHTLKSSNLLSGTNYIWLRLMRMGNTFVAHYSTNGVNWQYMWFTTVTMTNPIDVGLELTAHHYAELATATFDNVSTGNLTPLSGTSSSPAPTLLMGGQNWSPGEFQRVGGFEFLLGGVAGDYFTINSSTNLAKPYSSWPSLGTVTNIYGVVPIIDPQSLTNNTLFYGAKKLGGP